jgi:methylated-DNA-[protein]-cysteine S-methyltransferase
LRGEDYLRLYRKTFYTPIAEFTVICDNSNIIRLSFQNDKYEDWLLRYFDNIEFSGENELCRRCEREVSLYSSGTLKKFSVPAKLYGTSFQIRIWNTLLLIPYGKTETYAGIAKLSGAGGARAVGGAIAKNPIPIIYPCHRVIRADGSLGGFCGGYDMSAVKTALLAIEGVKVNPS